MTTPLRGDCKEAVQKDKVGEKILASGGIKQ
jgi:hypothetical protein